MRCPQSPDAILRKVAGENNNGVAGARIVGLGVELSVGETGSAVGDQIAKYVVVVIHPNPSPDHGLSVLPGVPRQPKLRCEIQVGLPDAAAQ